MYETTKKWRCRRGRPKLRWCEEVKENGAGGSVQKLDKSRKLVQVIKSHPGMWYQWKKKRKRRILAGEKTWLRYRELDLTL